MLIKESTEPGVVLGKAFVKAGEALGLRKGELAEVLGVDPARISRLGTNALKAGSKEWEIATFLVRIARGLHALNNGDQENTQHFMKTQNRMLQAVPKDELKRIDGLVRVLDFVDAMRGKV